MDHRFFQIDRLGRREERVGIGKEKGLGWEEGKGREGKGKKSGCKRDIPKSLGELVIAQREAKLTAF